MKIIFDRQNPNTSYKTESLETITFRIHLTHIIRIGLYLVALQQLLFVCGKEHPCMGTMNSCDLIQKQFKSIYVLYRDWLL